MDDLNQVAIAGRLTRDPQLRTTRSGTTICNLRVACNKMFFNIKIWGEQGQQLAANASKGDIVQVEGRLDWYEWSPGDGPRREFVGVVANDTPGAVRCIASSGGPSVPMGQGYAPGPEQSHDFQGMPEASPAPMPVPMAVSPGMGAPPLAQPAEAQIPQPQPQPVVAAQPPPMPQQPMQAMPAAAPAPAAAPLPTPAPQALPQPVPTSEPAPAGVPQPQDPAAVAMHAPMSTVGAQDFPPPVGVGAIPVGAGMPALGVEDPTPFSEHDPGGVPVGVSAPEGPEAIEEDSRFM